MKQREGVTASFSHCKECKALIHSLCTGDRPPYLQLQLLFQHAKVSIFHQLYEKAK